MNCIVRIILKVAVWVMPFIFINAQTTITFTVFDQNLSELILSPMVKSEYLRDETVSLMLHKNFNKATLNIKNPQSYILNYKNQNIELFLLPNTNYEISFTYPKLQTSTIIKGKNALDIQWINSKERAELTKPYQSLEKDAKLYSLDQYILIADSIMNSIKNQWNQSDAKDQLSPELQEYIMTNDIVWKGLRYIVDYEKNTYSLVDSLSNFYLETISRIQKIGFRPSQLHSPNAQYVQQKILKTKALYINAFDSSALSYSDQRLYQIMYFLAHNHPNVSLHQPLKSFVLYEWIYNWKKPSKLQDEIENYISTYLNNKEALSFKSKIKAIEAYNAKKTEPIITWQNKYDQPESNLQYLGNNTYIAVWASWCIPCIQELGALLDMFDSIGVPKNFRIIALSIDNDIATWTKTIKENDLDGVIVHGIVPNIKGQNLWLDKHNVSSLPHYMILDASGNKTSVRAPRPSQTRAIQKILYSK